MLAGLDQIVPLARAGRGIGVALRQLPHLAAAATLHPFDEPPAVEPEWDPAASRVAREHGLRRARSAEWGGGDLAASARSGPGGRVRAGARPQRPGRVRVLTARRGGRHTAGPAMRWTGRRCSNCWWPTALPRVSRSGTLSKMQAPGAGRSLESVADRCHPADGRGRPPPCARTSRPRGCRDRARMREARRRRTPGATGQSRMWPPRVRPERPWVLGPGADRRLGLVNRDPTLPDAQPGDGGHVRRLHRGHARSPTRCASRCDPAPHRGDDADDFPGPPWSGRTLDRDLPCGFCCCFGPSPRVATALAWVAGVIRSDRGRPAWTGTVRRRRASPVAGVGSVVWRAWCWSSQRECPQGRWLIRPCSSTGSWRCRGRPGPCLAAQWTARSRCRIGARACATSVLVG
jgi:hypothetical protein